MPVQARAKKDAKQLAAASLLEILLESVPFQDLLYKSVKQQQLRDLQVSAARSPLCPPALSAFLLLPAALCWLKPSRRHVLEMHVGFC